MDGVKDPRWRLHTSRDGTFCAIVSDGGSYGVVIDLDTGEVTLRLDRGPAWSDHFPYAFVALDGR